MIRTLKDRGLTLAAAESCTGGLLGKLLTDVPGSSAVFLLSAVTYSNSMKEKLLGVEAALLREQGAVSEACARAMAEGVRRLSGADLAVAITGIAGPTGGSLTKPVGTVYLAISDDAGTDVRHRLFPALDRQLVRSFSAEAALSLIHLRLTA
ncbi:MAG TPA: CinA family protein [Myxococcota bacterium]|nr:CinA family protein [Myxococcota bacterium]